MDDKTSLHLHSWSRILQKHLSLVIRTSLCERVSLLLVSVAHVSHVCQSRSQVSASSTSILLLLLLLFIHYLQLGRHPVVGVSKTTKIRSGEHFLHIYVCICTSFLSFIPERERRYTRAKQSTFTMRFRSTKLGVLSASYSLPRSVHKNGSLVKHGVSKHSIAGPNQAWHL